ncbi:MAG: GNAT family N-acetyltransferase [Vicinamibacterales bacterium]|nr:GNAT family N-acetyltransferase [Vicinamibacterales bacterium]
MNLQTKSLTLALQTLEEVRAMIAAMDPSTRKELSADWLARLEKVTAADPWVLGFSLRHRQSGVSVGTCGFKGPPSTDGGVEIAYGIAPEHQGKGYATEAAQALVTYAFTFDEVRVVRAHTLPGSDASKRVLAKCGFRHVGEVIDPEDGLVWRFENDHILSIT